MTNSHSSNRHYRPEDFEEKSRFRLNRAFLVIVLVIVATVTHYAAFLSGAYMKGRECRASAAQAFSTFPVCPAPVAYKKPLTQWQCTRTEFKEYREACKQRALSEIRIPPKE